MGQETVSVDQLYLIAEGLAQDFSLFPQKESASFLDGVLTERRIEQTLEKIRQMDVDSYIEAVVQPVEASARPGARSIVRALNVPILREIIDGPMYAAELEMDFGGELRRVGLLAQDRAVNNGVWGPTHHELAAKVAIEFAIESLPIVSMIDTPGADGGEEANTNGNGDAMVQCCYCNLVYCETCLTDKKPSTVPPTRSETNLAMMKASITGDANWACPCCWDLAATQLAKGARRNQKR